MPSCAGFLEPRKSRLGLLKSTGMFNAENFICSLSMSISVGFYIIRFWEEGGEGSVRLGVCCFLALRREEPLILASALYSDVICIHHNRSPTLCSAIDFSITFHFQMASFETWLFTAYSLPVADPRRGADVCPLELLCISKHFIGLCSVELLIKKFICQENY